MIELWRSEATLKGRKKSIRGGGGGGRILKKRRPKLFYSLRFAESFKTGETGGTFPEGKRERGGVHYVGTWNRKIFAVPLGSLILTVTLIFVVFKDLRSIVDSIRRVLSDTDKT